jgi:hypothetical protein
MIGEIVPSGDGREESVDELWLLQRRGDYLRGQMRRIKKTRLMAVRMERATRKDWRKESQVICGGLDSHSENRGKLGIK